MALSKPVAALSILAATLGGLCADRHWGFSYDLRELANDRDFGRRLQKRIDELGNSTNIYHLLELADPEATALCFEKRTWTFACLRQEADKLSVLLMDRGVAAGTCVALMMSNSPEFVIAVCALSRIGAIPALINTSLRKDTLSHCIRVSGPTFAIATPDLVPHMLDVTSTIVSLNLGSYSPLHLDEPRLQQIRSEDLAAVSPNPLSAPARQSLSDTGAYMYTSGTGGKPKAICVKNFLFVVVTVAYPLDARSPQKYFPLRLYSCLPLFHGTGFFGGVMYSIGNSSTLCLSRRFSASKFAKELYDSRATRMLYVGELCRYMLKAPASPYDRSHVCRVAYGNGMRPEVWVPFQKRFNIPEIREMYRSTEGVAKYDNAQRGSQGSGMVGRSGPIRQYFETTTYLVKYDEETQEPHRDPKTGFCLLARSGEVGEAIGRVASMPLYCDYLNNEQANEKKLMQNVFEKGDLFQRSGDLLVRYSNGWIRFCDRSGDTYRWKGENVSAGEVREHIARLPDVQDVSVYSTTLSNYDGQAGAAEIVLTNFNSASESTFMASLADRLKAGGLTNYQLPRLIRLPPEIQTTATFKYAASQTSRNIWDPSAERLARLYWLNGTRYVPLDSQSWALIARGEARL